MKRIAILGLGAMGSRVAQNLLVAQHQVVVYNRTAEKVKPLLDKGAIQATTLREAAEGAEIVISMVKDNNASRSVWLNTETGAIMGMTQDAIAIESSTLTIDWTRELSAKMQNRTIEFLDAPVSGSRPQAESRKLIYLVGGSSETLSKVEEVLKCSGTILHVGVVGQGTAMKLGVNALLGIQLAALAEILGMLQRNNISPAKAMECLGELPVTSPAVKWLGNLMANQNHAPLFPIALMEKDFCYFLQNAENLSVCTAAHEVYLKAIAENFSEQNITAIAKLYDS